MSYPRRGVALVINNIEFKKNKDGQNEKREGAEFDSKNLERVLSKLHFDVRLHQNQTKDEILKLLKEASEKDHLDADCFMCVIMSHGTKLPTGSLGIISVDNKTIDIETRAKSLFSNSKCSTLRNKPKLFFVDACWSEPGSVSNVMPINTQEQPTNSTSLAETSDNSVNAFYQTHPDISDFLFSFSTLPNYVSLRDRHRGNWFIQEFVSTLDEFGESRTLSDIMHKVRQSLIRKTTTQYAQMSIDHWVLSRHVIFKSKEKQILFSSKKNTFLLRLLNKEGNGNYKINKFPFLPLLTQIGTSRKFASLYVGDLQSIHIWVILGKQIHTLQVLSGHSHDVTALLSFDALMHNKKISVLASGSEDGSIRIWNVASGEFLQLIMAHEKKVTSLESIGQSKLASSSLDGTIRVWDFSFHFVLNYSIVDSGHILSIQIPRTGEQDPGMFVIACGRLIQVYDSTTGAFLQNIQTDVDISKLKLVGGHRIVIEQFVLNNSNTIKIYDVKTGKCENSLNEDYLYPLTMHWLGGETLAVVSYSSQNYFIDIWDLNSASHKRTINVNEGAMPNSFSFTLSLGNNRLVIGFRNNTILICNVDTEKCEHLAREDGNLGVLLKLLLLENGNLVSFHGKNIYSMDLVKIWNVETCTCVKTLKSEFFTNIQPFSMSNPENFAVELEGERFACSSKNNISIWNSNGFECELVGHTRNITALKWLGNSLLASGSEDCTVRIWQIKDASSGESKCIKTFTGHTKRIEALMLFGENRLASAVFGENVRVWNFDIRKELMIFNDIQQTENDEKNAQLFTSIGADKLAVVCPNKISVWNVISSAFMSDLSFNQEEVGSHTGNDKIISCLQSHGDRTLIGVVDSTTIVIWNVNTGEPIHVLKEHIEPITSLIVVSGRGNEFITGSLDGTIRVSDVVTGGCNVLEKDTESRILSLKSLSNDASHFLVLSENPYGKVINVIKRNQISNYFETKGFYEVSSLESIHFFFE